MSGTRYQIEAVTRQEIASVKEKMFHLSNKLSDLHKSLLDGDKSIPAHKVMQMRSTLTKYYLDLTEIMKSL